MDEPCKTANSRPASRGLHIHEIVWHRCNCACLWTLLSFWAKNHICAIMQILQIFSWKYANCTTGLLQPDWNVNVNALRWIFYTCRQFLHCSHNGNLFGKVHTVLDHLKYEFIVNPMSCLHGFTSADASHWAWSLGWICRCCYLLEGFS